MTRCRLILYILFCLPSTLLAHSLSDSYLELDVSEATIDGHWRIAIADLELAIGLDADGDGQINWGEVRQAREAINDHVLQRLVIHRGDSVCQLQAGNHQVASMNAGSFLHIPLSSDCRPDAALQIRYDFLFDIDASHRGMMTVNRGDSTSLLRFSPDEPVQTVTTDSPDALALWKTFLTEGIWHIWIGTDHILFLFALLVPIVLHQQRGLSPIASAELQPSGTTMWMAILKMVTAFTVAHSVTLILASLGWVELPSRLVESIIALSVLVSGLNILYPFFRGHHWQVAFVFGLVHGFGFAGVLGDLALPAQHFVSSLLAFNVGVEVGQLVVVLLVVPVLWLFRRARPAIRKTALTASGAVTAGIGLMWLAERSMNL